MSRLADSLYRLLLFALPADVRREFGGDMVQLFRDHRRATGPYPIRQLVLWAAALKDVLVHGVGERVARRPIPRVSLRPSMSILHTDVRHGLRLLRRYPASSLVALLTIAIGVGANTAIFSVVDAVLLRRLPYPEPDRLVMIWEKRPREGVLINVVSPADYLDWRRLNPAFEHVAGYTPISASITGDGEPVQVGAAGVGWSFFDVLRVRPAVGRTFQSADEVVGQHRIVIIGHSLWQSRYGSDRAIIGRRLTLNGAPFEVVGVLPADFQFIDPTIQIWAPLPLEGTGTPPSRVSHYVDVYARLKPDVTMAQAVEAMDRVGLQLEQEYPKENNGHGAHVMSMQDYYVGPVRKSLVFLSAAVGFVLLIACVNVASLLLARSVSRRREMAVRSALGASRGRLVAQTLTESLSLAIVGGLLGVAVAALVLKALPAVMPERLSIVGLSDIQLDLRVLLFAFGVSVATGLAFGSLPSLQASRPEMTDALKAGGRDTGGVRRRLRAALVIGEVALAALTLVGAGLVIRSFGEVLSQPLGFDPAGRLSVTISAPRARYRSPDERRLVLATIEQRLAVVPGVTDVGAINILPLGGGEARTGIAIEGRESQPGDPPTRMHPRAVTPGYFKAMGIRVIKGRGFSPDDHERAEPVVVIGETSARRFWPNEDPIGKRIHFGGDETWRTIVGIAGDVKHWGLAQDVNPTVYWPQAQAAWPDLTFVLKSEVGSESLTSAVRAAVKEIDPNLPLANVRSLDDVVSRSLRSDRAQAVLMGTFGALALVLAVIGIYGVTSQLVTARVREIGVRMTLGARPADVFRQLLAEGLWQTIAGLVLGLAAGVLLVRATQTTFFNTAAWDPLTLTAVSGVLIVAALAACLIPARRAMRVDPVEALRH